MTQCAKIQELLVFWVTGDLSDSEGETVSRHVEICPSCRESATAYQSLLEELNHWVVPNPGDLFFRRQFNTIAGDLPKSPDEDEPLVGELQQLPCSDPGEAFFTQQRQSILEHIQLEAAEEDPSIQSLVAELQSLSVPDPGELFFKRQFQSIQSQVRREIRQDRPSVWWRPLAVAAAIFFLVLGTARITNRQEEVPSGEWRWAMETMAQEEEEETGLEDLDLLSQEQLDVLAHNLEGSILRDAEENLREEPVDYHELDNQELDFLIQRLEASVQT